MSRAYASIDPLRVQEFLSSFDTASRSKGENYFNHHRVKELLASAGDGSQFQAVVEGSFSYTVELRFSREAGWSAECSCPVRDMCKHAYAAMKLLLLRHQREAKGLTTYPTVDPSQFRPFSRPQPADKSQPLRMSLAPMIEEVLDRPLTREELGFLQRFSAIYAQCSATRQITYGQLTELGISLRGSFWSRLSLWPEFPKSEHEFWLYIANAILKEGHPLPSILAPITDLTPIQEPLRRWEREKSIKNWSQLLSSVIPALDQTPAEAPKQIELRMVFRKDRAVVEWKREDMGNFELLKIGKFHSLAHRHDSVQAAFGPESELIARLLDPGAFRSDLEFEYRAGEERRLLGNMLRLPALEGRLVNSAGQPLARSSERLEWRLTPALDENDDYRLRLASPNGAVPEIWTVFPGHPTLYLTPDGLFPGPALIEGGLDPAVENVIPAPALETPSGVQMLDSLRVPMPDRIAQRIVRIPFRLAIQCKIEPVYPGSKTEECKFEVRAESDDGVRKEVWISHSWTLTEPLRKNRQTSGRNGAITFYDRSQLAEIPALMAPLEGVFNDFKQALTLRITKKFPERFVSWLKSVPPHIAVELDSELSSLAQDPVSGSVRLDASETAIDWFDLKVIVDVSDATLAPEEIKLLLNARGGYVRLEKKGWRRLAFNFTAEDDERLARLGLSPRELSAEPQRLHALQLADESAKKFLPEGQVQQLQRRAHEIKARVTPEIPAIVQAELRPYQREGFNFLAYLSTNRFGGILADDMGLGKTLQALTWLEWLRSQPKSPADLPVPRSGCSHQPSLVVCPKSVMDNWEAEAARFTPQLRVRIWPPSAVGNLADHLGEADLHVINYSQLRMIGEGIAGVLWLAVILDEGQYIKNPNSQTAQIARVLKAEHRLVLSGTPIENRLMDLWSLMAFAMPGVLGSRSHFGRLFDAKGDPLARRRLAARVRPFLLRRTKTQVAKDLPDKIEEDLFCEMEGPQRALYRAELKRAQQLLLKVTTQKQLAKEQLNFLTALLRLRQICCHPALVCDMPGAASAKLEALLEQIEPLMDEGHKVLIFSQFVQMLHLLKPVIEARNWRCFYLAGDTENRGDLVQNFQTAEGAAVFLISLKAGGFGLNLTAASYVVLFDPWWNPAVENQAIDRTHRIGQTNKVIAYRLLIKNSIEEKIRLLQKQKNALAVDVLGEERFAQSLTLSDFQFLFAD